MASCLVGLESKTGGNRSIFCPHNAISSQHQNDVFGSVFFVEGDSRPVDIRVIETLNHRGRIARIGSAELCRFRLDPLRHLHQTSNSR